MIPNESMKEGEFFAVLTSISMTDFVLTDPYLFGCEFTGESP